MSDSALLGVDPLLAVDDLPAYGFTPVQARKLFNRRAFALVQIGRRLYVQRSDFEAYLNAKKIPARESK
jgi:hypothetical protein